MKKFIGSKGASIPMLVMSLAMLVFATYFGYRYFVGRDSGNDKAAKLYVCNNVLSLALDANFTTLHFDDLYMLYRERYPEICKSKNGTLFEKTSERSLYVKVIVENSIRNSVVKVPEYDKCPRPPFDPSTEGLFFRITATAEYPGGVECSSSITRKSNEKTCRFRIFRADHNGNFKEGFAKLRHPGNSMILLLDWQNIAYLLRGGKLMKFYECTPNDCPSGYMKYDESVSGSGARLEKIISYDCSSLQIVGEDDAGRDLRIDDSGPQP